MLPVKLFKGNRSGINRRRGANDFLRIATFPIPFVEPFLGRDQGGENRPFIVDREMGLMHKVVADILLAEVGVDAHPTHIRSREFLTVIKHPVGECLQGGNNVMVDLAGVVVFILKVHERFRVVED